MNGAGVPASPPPDDNSRRSVKVALGLIVIVVGSLILPVWVNGQDFGWSSCGSVVFKSDVGDGGRAADCELIGAYSDRLVVTIGALALLVMFGLRQLRQLPASPARRGAAVSLGFAAVGAAALSTMLWTANDERLPPYRYEDIDVTFVSTPAVQEGSYEVVVTGRRWTAPAPVIVTTCVAFPADCDMANAIEVEPVDGEFEVTLMVSDPAGLLRVAAFDKDVEYYAVIAVDPRDRVRIAPSPPPR